MKSPIFRSCYRTGWSTRRPPRRYRLSLSERWRLLKTAFTYSNFGLAATMAVAIMVMILVIYVVQNKIIHGLILKEGRK